MVSETARVKVEASELQRLFGVVHTVVRAVVKCEMVWRAAEVHE